MSANSAYGVYFTYFTPQGLHSVTNHLNSSDQRFYDGVQRLATVNHFFNPPGYTATWSYGYNPASQLASVARSNDIYAWNGHYAVNRPYTTDGLNRYTAAGGASFLYDLNGNLTSDGSRTYTYDIENRLVGASGGLTLAYDPLGRLHRTSGGPSGTTTYLYDPGSGSGAGSDALVEEYSGANVLLRRYVHGAGADVPLIWYEGANIRRYLHADHQGSIVAIGQAYAAPYAINRYDEYGIPAATNMGRFQYTGQIWLPDLGMYHYKARVYSPTLGRFLQVDPIGYDDQFNLYAYVGNDPINRTDPTGMQLGPVPIVPIVVVGGRACISNPACRAFIGQVLRQVVPRLVPSIVPRPQPPQYLIHPRGRRPAGAGGRRANWSRSERAKASKASCISGGNTR